MPDTELRPREPMLGSRPPFLPAATPVCANCGSALAGPYCSHCGQHVADFHRSVWRFVAEFLDNTICWDNKLFRTLGPLFKRPGFLTAEFMVGRRARYVHPLRLFLFTSAICLTLLKFGHDNLVFVNTGHAAPRAKKHGSPVTTGDSGKPAETPFASPASPGGTSSGDAAGDADAVSIKAAVADAIAKGRQNETKNADDVGDKFARDVLSRIDQAGGTDRFKQNLADNVQQRLSWVALALLPVFALGLRAVYWRKDSYYFAHLIFSLHYHTFLLLFWTAYTGLVAVVSLLPLGSVLATMMKLGLLAPLVYLYVALRRLFGEGPKRTAVKVTLLGSMHLLAIVIGVSTVATLAYLNIKA